MISFQPVFIPKTSPRFGSSAADTPVDTNELQLHPEIVGSLQDNEYNTTFDLVDQLLKALKGNIPANFNAAKQTLFQYLSDKNFCLDEPLQLVVLQPDLAQNKPGFDFSNLEFITPEGKPV